MARYASEAEANRQLLLRHVPSGGGAGVRLIGARASVRLPPGLSLHRVRRSLPAKQGENLCLL